MVFAGAAWFAAAAFGRAVAPADEAVCASSRLLLSMARHRPRVWVSRASPARLAAQGRPRPRTRRPQSDPVRPAGGCCPARGPDRSVRRILTRLPTRNAVRYPASIQFLTVCWLSLSSSATSVTVRNSSSSRLTGGTYRADCTREPGEATDAIKSSQPPSSTPAGGIPSVTPRRQPRAAHRFCPVLRARCCW
jgi:hypothetical protein